MYTVSTFERRRNNHHRRSAMPDQYYSLEQFHRLHHLDLPNLSDVGLWRERRRVEYQIAFHSGPEDDAITTWLLARFAAVCSELQARKINHADWLAGAANAGAAR